MKNKFFNKYINCYKCIKEKEDLLVCPNAYELPIRYQSRMFLLCNFKFKKRILKIFDKLFKHKKYLKRKI